MRARSGLLALFACAACGSDPPPKAAAPVQEESHEVKPQLKMKSELGSVDPDAVTRAFHRLDDAFSSCQQQGLSRVEKCLLDAVMGARWPKPDGGDAEARYSLELQAQGRPATDWSSDKVAAALGKAGSALDQCTSGTSGFKGTLYVGPGGHVLAAGVAVPSKDGATKADCVAKVLGKLKGLPSPGSWPAKVTFGL